MPFDDLVFRDHALRQMLARFITEVDVRQVLEEGSNVANYPEDLPYPSFLVLGFVEGRPLHVVAADNQFEKKTIVITVYEPDSNRWDSTFTKRT